MVIGTAYEYVGNQLEQDISPILHQYGYTGRAYTLVVDDGAPAHSHVTEWVDRDLGTVTVNAQVPGFVWTSPANVSTGTLRRNYTQILAKVLQVTGTTDAIDVMVGGNALEDQTKLRMEEYLNDLEYNQLNATVLTGGSGLSARQMYGVFDYALNFGITAAGARSWTTTNTNATLDTTHLRDMQVRAQKKGANITDFIVDDTIKTRISNTSSTSEPVYRIQSDSSVIRNVDRYGTDFGKSRLHWSNYVEHELAGTTGLFGTDASAHIVLGIDRTQINRAWLRRSKIEPKAKTEDAETRVIYGEVTQRYMTPAAIQVDWNIK